MKNRKQDEGKLRYDLIPYGALDEAVAVMNDGAIKYEPNNWLKASGPEDISRYEAALGRHYSLHMQDEIFDKDSGRPHMAHIMCNAMFIITLRKKFKKELKCLKKNK
jgi:hypothetical protein